MADTLYRWFWKARLPDRRGELFRVLARGALNSCLIQFEDGGRVVMTADTQSAAEVRYER